MITEYADVDDWLAEARGRFGPDPREWGFVCPACGHVATPDDWKAAGAPDGSIAFSCVGRWLPETSPAFSGGKGPCDYAGGGLIGLNPVRIQLPGGPVYRFGFALAPTPWLVRLGERDVEVKAVNVGSAVRAAYRHLHRSRWDGGWAPPDLPAAATARPLVGTEGFSVVLRPGLDGVIVVEAPRLAEVA